MADVPAIVTEQDVDLPITVPAASLDDLPFVSEAGSDRGGEPVSGRSRCRPRTHGRPAGPTPAMSPEPHRQDYAFDQATKLSLEDILKHLLVQRQTRYQPPQPPAPCVELLRPLHLRRHKTAALRPPKTVGPYRYPGLPTDLLHRRACSACRRIKAICRSLNLDLRICSARSLSKARNRENIQLAGRGPRQRLIGGH